MRRPRNAAANQVGLVERATVIIETFSAVRLARTLEEKEEHLEARYCDVLIAFQLETLLVVTCSKHRLCCFEPVMIFLQFLFSISKCLGGRRYYFAVRSLLTIAATVSQPCDLLLAKFLILRAVVIASLYVCLLIATALQVIKSSSM